MSFRLDRQVAPWRLLQVGGVKVLGEPTVDLRQELARFCALILTLPELAQAHGRPQLPGVGLLAAGDGKSLATTGVGLGMMLHSAREQPLPLSDTAPPRSQSILVSGPAPVPYPGYSIPL